MICSIKQKWYQNHSILLLSQGTESSCCNTFLVRCRGHFRSDSVGQSVDWKVGSKSVRPLPCLQDDTICLVLQVGSQQIEQHWKLLLRRLMASSKFSLKISKLKLHDMIAKLQTRHFKIVKKNLKPGEFLIGGDFKL